MKLPLNKNLNLNIYIRPKCTISNCNILLLFKIMGWQLISCIVAILLFKPMHVLLCCSIITFINNMITNLQCHIYFSY